MTFVRRQTQLYTVPLVRVDLVNAQDIGSRRTVLIGNVIAAHVASHIVGFIPVEVVVASWVTRGQKLAMVGS